MLGSDYKVFEDDYSGRICRVKKPARDGTRDLKPLSTYPVGIAKTAFPGSAGTSPPEVDFDSAHDDFGRQWSRQRGAVWRSGIKLDCYKYIPAFTSPGSTMQLPERSFVRDLEQAFETKLVEVGLFG